MHSPPVQPISSSRSGTGSVRTMWEEATVRLLRSGARGAFAAAPTASTAAPARTAPPAVRASTPSGRVKRTRSVTGERSRPPPRSPAAARAGRAPAAPAAPSPRRGRRPRRGRQARRSARPPRPGESALDRVGRAQLAAGGQRLGPDPVVRRRGRDLEVAGVAEPGVDPLLLAELPDPGDSLLGGPRHGQRRRVPPPLPHVRQREPHHVAEPPIPPARPKPTDPPRAGPPGPRAPAP